MRRQIPIGNIFYGSNGYLAVDGYDAYKTWITIKWNPDRRKAAGDHYANFIDCVRSPPAQDIHSPIEERKHLDDAGAPGQPLLPPWAHVEI